MIKFKLGDTVYEYDDSQMSVKEARLIKKHTSMGLKSWSLGLQDMDPDALVGLILLAKQRAGEAVRWQDLDNLNVNDITIVGDDEDLPAETPEDADVAPPASPSRRSSTGGRTRNS